MSEGPADYDAGEALRFGAQVFKIQTLIDGGVRLTLDLVSPVSHEVITSLFDAKQPGVILQCAAVAVLQSVTNGETKTYKRATRSPIDLAGG
jgi:hypothetical protein